MNKLILESLSGIKEVKLYNCQDKYIARVDQCTKLVAHAGRFNNIYSQTPKLFLEVECPVSLS